MKYCFFLVLAFVSCIAFARVNKPKPARVLTTAEIIARIQTNMVTIPAGSFTMGGNFDVDSSAMPAHKVTLSAFKINKYETTIREFKAFVDATGYNTDAEKQGWSYVWYLENKVRRGISWRDDEQGHERDTSQYDMPVLFVSWNDAVAYCNWLSQRTSKIWRLPTEAEWEYAAGNGVRHTMYSWGSFSPGSNDKVGNVGDETPCNNDDSHFVGFTNYIDGYCMSSPVGKFPPNLLGLYDMTGNVWEWCSDWYDKDYYRHSPVNDPKGPVEGTQRVYRGGSWMSDSKSCRVEYRNVNKPAGHEYHVSFRVVTMP